MLWGSLLTTLIPRKPTALRFSHCSAIFPVRIFAFNPDQLVEILFGLALAGGNVGSGIGGTVSLRSELFDLIPTAFTRASLMK